jgi:hypothetical protein
MRLTTDNLTDNEILSNQNKFFNTAILTALAVSKGVSKSLIYSGPAGIGKSYGIEKALKRHSKIGFINGHVTSTGIFSLLYEYRAEGSVILIDDCDQIFENEVSLNLLKGALDLKPIRRLSFRSRTQIILEKTGEIVPQTFDFKVIFITNININSVISKHGKLEPHLSALISRSLYLDGYSIFNQPRDYLLRIALLSPYIYQTEGMSKEEQVIIDSFIENHQDNLMELSLRLVTKLCNIMRIAGYDNFENMARLLTCKN